MYRKRREASGDDNGPLCSNKATREQGSCQPKGVKDGSSNVVNQWKVDTRRQASCNFDRKWGVGSSTNRRKSSGYSQHALVSPCHWQLA